MIDGNTWSPVSKMPDSGSHAQMWSTVWPGVCTANQSRSPIRMRAPWCTRWVGSGGVNNMRMARIISLRRRGGPSLRVPHGVIAPHGLDVASVSTVSSCTTSASSAIVGSSSGSTSSDCASIGRLDLGALRLALGQRAVRARALHRPRRERVVRDQLGAGLACDAARAAEVVGMRVGDHHGVDVLEPVAGGLQPLLQRLPRLRARQARIDHGEPAVVDEAVHVHVTETRHPDRQLHAQHAGRDLGDLFRRRLLLLAGRARRSRLRVGHDRQGIQPPPSNRRDAAT